MKKIPKKLLNFPESRLSRGALVRAHFSVHEGKLRIHLRLNGPKIETFGTPFLDFKINNLPLNVIKSKFSAVDFISTLEKTDRSDPQDWSYELLQAAFWFLFKDKITSIHFLFKKNDMLWVKIKIGSKTFGPIEGEPYRHEDSPLDFG